MKIIIKNKIKNLASEPTLSIWVKRHKYYSRFINTDGCDEKTTILEFSRDGHRPSLDIKACCSKHQRIAHHVLVVQTDEDRLSEGIRLFDPAAD